jgi:hypothetical protein
LRIGAPPFRQRGGGAGSTKRASARCGDDLKALAAPPRISLTTLIIKNNSPARVAKGHPLIVGRIGGPAHTELTACLNNLWKFGPIERLRRSEPWNEYTPE